MQTTTDPPCTVLGGTLRRAGPDYWQWSDGTPAPEVYDLTVGSCHSFRCITYGCGTTYVQVPATLARSEPELRWIVEDRAAGSRRRTAAWNSHAPARGRGGIILVSAEDWDAHAGDVCGAGWEGADEHTVLGRARALGWRPPAV